MSIEAPDEFKTIQDVQNSPEYMIKLENATADAIRFADRVRVVAEGNPTEADIQQLRDEYQRISESALVAHDSIPDSVNRLEDEKNSGLKIKGTDGLFMGHIRVTLLKELGNGDYSAQTSARKLFDSIIGSDFTSGLYERRDRRY